jgi:thymidine kinase/deoxynucleoside kinase
MLNTNSMAGPDAGERRYTIAIEGNIAAGKSTLLEKLEAGGEAQIVVEPVEKWQTLVPGPNGNIMQRMYEDPQRWAYLFQSYVLLTMMEAHAVEQTKLMRVMERSVYSARWCFIENLRKSEPPMIDDLEYKVYQRWFDWLMETNRPQVDLIVYLRTSPTTCMDRLKKRGRSEEASVPLDYLQSLHARYEEWLIDNPTQHGDDVPVLVLDCDADCDADPHFHDKLAEQINEAVRKMGKKPVVLNPTSAMTPPITPVAKTVEEKRAAELTTPDTAVLKVEQRRALFSDDKVVEAVE